jgi:hypothetical protein
MTDPDAFHASAGFWAVLIFVWFALSVAYRRYRGNPVFATPDPGAVFVERWASGRFGSGLTASLSTARNCLQVEVSGGVLRIHPHFPFTLGFVPELYGMDQVVPLGRVRSATIVDGRRANIVEVKLLAADGQEQTHLLLLRHAEKFIAAVCGPAQVSDPQAPG